MFVLRGKKMSVINVTFPDGNEEEFEKNVSGYDVAKFIRRFSKQCFGN